MDTLFNFYALQLLKCILSSTLKFNIMRQAFLENRIKSAEPLAGYILYSFIHRDKNVAAEQHNILGLTEDKLLRLIFARCERESSLMVGLHKGRHRVQWFMTNEPYLQYFKVKKSVHAKTVIPMPVFVRLFFELAIPKLTLYKTYGTNDYLSIREQHYKTASLTKPSCENEQEG